MKRAEQKRIDRKHRFHLRVEEPVHSEVDALAFRHNLSLNVAYCEAIRWALTSDAFHVYMQDNFPRDTRRGHFIYVKDSNVVHLPRRS